MIVHMRGERKAKYMTSFYFLSFFFFNFFSIKKAIQFSQNFPGTSTFREKSGNEESKRNNNARDFPGFD